MFDPLFTEDEITLEAQQPAIAVRFLDGFKDEYCCDRGPRVEVSIVAFPRGASSIALEFCTRLESGRESDPLLIKSALMGSRQKSWEHCVRIASVTDDSDAVILRAHSKRDAERCLSIFGEGHSPNQSFKCVVWEKPEERKLLLSVDAKGIMRLLDASDEQLVREWGSVSMLEARPYRHIVRVFAGESQTVKILFQRHFFGAQQLIVRALRRHDVLPWVSELTNVLSTNRHAFRLTLEHKGIKQTVKVKSGMGAQHLVQQVCRLFHLSPSEFSMQVTGWNGKLRTEEGFKDFQKWAKTAWHTVDNDFNQGKRKRRTIVIRICSTNGNLKYQRRRRRRSDKPPSILSVQEASIAGALCGVNRKREWSNDKLRMDYDLRKKYAGGSLNKTLVNVNMNALFSDSSDPAVSQLPINLSDSFTNLLSLTEGDSGAERSDTCINNGLHGGNNHVDKMMETGQTGCDFMGLPLEVERESSMGGTGSSSDLLLPLEDDFFHHPLTGAALWQNQDGGTGSIISVMNAGIYANQHDLDAGSMVSRPFFSLSQTHEADAPSSDISMDTSKTRMDSTEMAREGLFGDGKIGWGEMHELIDSEFPTRL